MPDLRVMIAGLAILAIAVLGVQGAYRPFSAEARTGYLARESVLDVLDDAVLIDDRDDRLFDFDEEARTQCTRSGSRAFGRSTPYVIGTAPIEFIERSLSLSTRFGRWGLISINCHSRRTAVPISAMPTGAVLSRSGESTSKTELDPAPSLTCQPEGPVWLQVFES